MAMERRTGVRLVGALQRINGLLEASFPPLPGRKLFVALFVLPLQEVLTMDYRLSLTIGPKYLGWSVISLDPQAKPRTLERCGVRIFPDGRNSKTMESLAVARGLARRASRKREHYLRRRKQLLQALTSYGLLPSREPDLRTLERLDPYALRAKGITSRLELAEFGRALFHLNQRRGFQGNSRPDTGTERTEILQAAQRLRDLMLEAGTPTLGAYLHLRKTLPTPLHVRLRAMSDGRPRREFFPDRSIVEEEFAQLWAVQARHHAQLTEDLRLVLHGIIFSQRPRQPRQPAMCILEPQEARAPKATPLAQRVRIYQELHQIRILSKEEERPLSLSERDQLVETLLKGRRLTPESVLAKLKLTSEYDCRFGGAHHDRVEGDLSAAVLSKKNCLGVRWFGWDLEQQQRLVQLLLTEENEDLLVRALVDDWGLSLNQASTVATTELPSGHSLLSYKALSTVYSQLQRAVIPFGEAVSLAGYAPEGSVWTGGMLSRLPYYGIVLQRHVTGGHNHPAASLEERYGRIADPTMHIVLNQVRKVVNSLIKEFGPPAHILLSVARELQLGTKRRKNKESWKAQQQEEKSRRKKVLREKNIPATAENLLRFRLWEELGLSPDRRECPYSGEPLPFERVFDHDVVVDYLLPFSRTLDHSPANLTLCLRHMAEAKHRRTPHEAFAQTTSQNIWTGIRARADLLPPNKRWRFGPDAMTRFCPSDDLCQKQLIDLSYAASLTRKYLSVVCPIDEVQATPGRLLGLCVRLWDLPRLASFDHRRHALDAIVLGVLDESMFRDIASASVRAPSGDAFTPGWRVRPPWRKFQGDVCAALEGVVVSHKGDHGVSGKLHKDTAYGILEDNGTQGNAQHRVFASSITDPAQLLAVKGFGLRAEMLRAVTGQSLAQCRAILSELSTLRGKEAKQQLKALVVTPPQEFIERLRHFLKERGIRRVRVRETARLIALSDKEGRPYKGLKSQSNAFYAIHKDSEGRWIGGIVPIHEAHAARLKQARPTPPGVVRLFKNDMIELEDAGTRRIVYVVKISEKQLVLAEHFEGDLNKRARDKPPQLIRKSLAMLQQVGARFLFVSPTGEVKYLPWPSN